MRLLLLLVVGGGMLILSWARWADLLVDFGAQVYIPWQISTGKVLYRDISYLYGPFSGYLHGLVFKVFGPGIMTLCLFNIAVVAALTGLIFVIMKKLSGPWTATWCGVVFLSLFAFGQYRGGGNFNFVTAYVYELPHGVFLSFIALFLFMKFLERPGALLISGVGLVTGLVYLTKPEVFLALFVAMMCGVGWTLISDDRCRERRSTFALLFIVGFFAPILIFLVYFSLHMPVYEAATALIQPWLNVLDPSIRSMKFYRWIRGTDAPGANTLWLVLFALFWVLTIALFAKVSPFASPWFHRHRHSVWVFDILLLAALVAAYKHITWLDLLRPLPLLPLAIGAGCAWRLMRGTQDPEQRTRTLFLLSYCVFSFVLLLKMILNVHVYHYGFALVFPATLLLVKAVCHDLPRKLEARGRPTLLFRHATAVILLMVMGSHVWIETQVYQLKGYLVATGRDHITDYHLFLNPRGKVVRDTVDYIRKELPPEADLAAIPHGSMINYLARKSNPVPMLTYNPAEALLLKEEDYLQILKSHAPSHILLVDIDSSIFEARYFGQDYARPVYEWIRQAYVLDRQFGAIPYTGNGFGIQVLKRRPILKPVG